MPRTAPYILCLLILLALLAGCGRKEQAAFFGEPFGTRPCGVKDELPYNSTPRKGPRISSCPAPAGGYSLEYKERTDYITLKDRHGNVLDTIKLPADYSVRWQPGGEHFAYLERTRSDEPGALHIYSVQEKKDMRPGWKTFVSPYWSKDGGRLAVIHAGRIMDRMFGSRYACVKLLDARRSFKLESSFGKDASEFCASPSGGRIAFQDFTLDEAGEKVRRSLCVVDFNTGCMHRLATSRRPISFRWAGDDNIAASVYDKYAVPAIYLFSLDGQRKVLVRDNNACELDIWEYQPEKKRLVYVKYASRRGKESRWYVTPGGKPVRMKYDPMMGLTAGTPGNPPEQPERSRGR